MKSRLFALFLVAALLLPVLGVSAQDGYNEAPMLAEMVEAGDLPPVEERLPENPLVLPVYEEIGQYGGTWRRAYKGVSDRWGPTKLIEEYPIEFYMADGESPIEMQLRWVEQFDTNEDASVYTVRIRPGLKWSDGMPVTTEDVRFWYEDVFLNEELTPSISPTYAPGGEPMKVDIVDEYTFTVTFATPYPLFEQIAAKNGTQSSMIGTPFLWPAHYMKNFHADYADADELQAVVEENNQEIWTDLWGSGPIGFWFLNPDLPVISAWKITVPPPADQIVMERNPYYYAVDDAGNQLPYIDYITHDLFENNETLNLWVVQGQIDMQNRHLSVADYSLFKENEEAGNYRVLTWRNASTGAVYPNTTVQDEGLRELFNDIRFREALSVAIDREEINDIVFLGLGEPRQASPVTGSPQFDPEFETKWIEYDPDRANELLDEIGLTERDGEGFRLRLDGQPLAITVETTATGGGATVDMLELVSAYWADVGIKALVTPLERSLYEEHLATGEMEMGVWGFDRNSVVTADPGRYLGTITDGPWAPRYGIWYSNQGREVDEETAQNMEEPPADHPLWEIWDIWDQARTAPSLEEALEIFQGIIDIHKENVWVIGIIGEEPAVYITSNRMRNMPDNLIQDDTLRSQGLSQPAQLFLIQE
jgi:peptide/nickel transport system substrate-binding protein